MTDETVLSKKARRKCRRKMYDASLDLQKAAERFDAGATYLGRDFELGRLVREAARDTRAILGKIEKMQKKLHAEDVAAMGKSLTIPTSQP